MQTKGLTHYSRVMDLKKARSLSKKILPKIQISFAKHPLRENQLFLIVP